MASVYLVLKLEGMNPQYCTGFENACVSCEKLVFHNEGGVSQRLKYKKRRFRSKGIRK